MKIPIVFFSATGNTEYICKLVKKGMESQGLAKQEIMVDLVPIQTAMKESLNFEEIPVLGIASPIYEFDFTRVIKKWMKTIPRSGSPKKTFLIDTSGGITGGAIKLAKEMMMIKNYSPLGALEIAAPTLEPFGSNRWFPAKWRKAALDKAFYFGALLGNRILKNREDYIDLTIRIPGSGWLTKLTRFAQSNPVWKKVWTMGDFIGYNASKCTKCRKCETSCPMGAIDLSRKKAIDYYECMFCATCVRICPKGALYIVYRPNAVLPKKDEGPKSMRGYIDPDSFVPDKRLFLSRSIWEILFRAI